MTMFMQMAVTGSARPLWSALRPQIHAEAESSARLQLLRTNIFSTLVSLDAVMIYDHEIPSSRDFP